MALCEYQPLPHRLRKGRRPSTASTYLNDSKATNIDALEKALIAMTRPVVLIAGGKDKGLDFSGLRSLVREKVKAAVLIGQMAEKLASIWGSAIPCVKVATLADAVVQAARARRNAGDNVLLSPGCSSYDMFKSFEDRGDQFRVLAQSLRPSPTPLETPTTTTTRKHTMDTHDLNPKTSTDRPGLKLMTVFIAVLALHIVVIGGFTVYHLMSAGTSDADLLSDKTHRDVKVSPDALLPGDTTVTETATSPPPPWRRMRTTLRLLRRARWPRIPRPPPVRRRPPPRSSGPRPRRRQGRLPPRQVSPWFLLPRMPRRWTAAPWR